MSNVLDYVGRLVVLDCYACHIRFGLPEEFNQAALLDKSIPFYCPNGHRQFYVEGALQRKEKELAEAKAALERARKDTERVRGYLTEEQNGHRSTVKRLNATKGVVTRYKRRITAGACVCCSRKFKDLERHMKNVHPHFDPDKHIEAVAATA